MLTEVVDKFMQCGDFAKGFARVRCDECSHKYLLAFSCTGGLVLPVMPSEKGASVWRHACGVDPRGRAASSFHIHDPKNAATVLSISAWIQFGLLKQLCRIAHHMKLALAIKQSVRHQRVQVRMEVEIFAESVDRHDDGWNAIVRRVANAACIAERITQKVTHAPMRDAAELLEQSAVKSKVRPQHLWDRECEVSMRHRREDRLRKHRAKYLHLLLMA